MPRSGKPSSKSLQKRLAKSADGSKLDVYVESLLRHPLYAELAAAVEENSVAGFPSECVRTRCGRQMQPAADADAGDSLHASVANFVEDALRFVQSNTEAQNIKVSDFGEACDRVLGELNVPLQQRIKAAKAAGGGGRAKPASDDTSQRQRFAEAMVSVGHCALPTRVLHCCSAAERLSGCELLLTPRAVGHRDVRVAAGRREAAEEHQRVADCLRSEVRLSLHDRLVRPAARRWFRRVAAVCPSARDSWTSPARNRDPLLLPCHLPSAALSGWARVGLVLCHAVRLSLLGGQGRRQGRRTGCKNPSC